jgi:hypothetical protein
MQQIQQTQNFSNYGFFKRKALLNDEEWIVKNLSKNHPVIYNKKKDNNGNDPTTITTTTIDKTTINNSKPSKSNSKREITEKDEIVEVKNNLTHSETRY